MSATERSLITAMISTHGMALSCNTEYLSGNTSHEAYRMRSLRQQYGSFKFVKRKFNTTRIRTPGPIFQNFKKTMSAIDWEMRLRT